MIDTGCHCGDVACPNCGYVELWNRHSNDVEVEDIVNEIDNCISVWYESCDKDELMDLLKYLKGETIVPDLDHILQDLKYLNRLNYLDFKELLFKDSIDSYVQPKWELWLLNPLHFLWGCSADKIELLKSYIEKCKGE